MTWIKVKIITCPTCSYGFSPRNSQRKIVKAPLAVIEAVLNNQQRCPACKRSFKKGELASEEDRATIATAIAKFSKPKRSTTCSICGAPGHNKQTCKAATIANRLVHDDDGLCNDDLGMCPHGSTDDEGCEEPGCFGGPEGYDAVSGHY